MWPDALVLGKRAAVGGLLTIMVGAIVAASPPPMSIVSAPCNSVTASASPASPSLSSTAVTITGVASGCPNPLYAFWIVFPGSNSWQLVQAYSTNTAFHWDSTGDPPGTYEFSVWARDASSAGTSGNSLGRWDALVTIAYTLTPLPFTPCTGTAVSVTPSGGTALSGTTVTMTFTAYGCPKPLFKLWMEAPGSGTWQLLSSYRTSRTFKWGTTGMAAGDYAFRLFVRDASSPGVYSEGALGRYDAYGNFGYNLSTQPCISVSASPSPPSPSSVGTVVTITGYATGCPKPLYKFWLLPPGSSSWHLVRAYLTSPTFTWNTSSAAKGVYHFQVWARDYSSIGTSRDSLGTWDAYSAFNYTLT